MTEFSSCHRDHDALRFAVADALKGVSESGVLRDAVNCAIASVLATVHSVIADVAQTWNDRYKDPLRRLPLEIHVSCLQWLTVDELLLASHVSRDWRAATLSEPRLWASYELGPGTKATDKRALLLCLTLQRSKPHPFDFSWAKEGWMPQAVLDILAAPEHTSRLRILILNGPIRGSLSDLLDGPFPQLRTFVLTAACRIPGGRLQLPVSWNAQTVPQLRSVTLHTLDIPTEAQPLPSVTKIALAKQLDCSRVFELFPCAESVELDVLDSGMPMARTIGKHVTNFVVRAWPFHIVDCSQLLFDYDWRLVPDMAIQSKSIARPLAWFSRQVDGEWQLRLDRSDDFVLPAHSYREERIALTMTTEERSPGDSTKYSLRVALCFRRIKEHIPLSHAINLTTITFGNHTMLPFLLELPLHSVRSLIIGLPEPLLDAARVLAWIRSCPAPVSASVVQDLQFDFGPDGEIVTSDVIELIKAVPRMLLLHAAHRLETVRLLGCQVLALRNRDFSFAWEFCEHVRLEDGDHGCSLRRTDTMKLS